VFSSIERVFSRQPSAVSNESSILSSMAMIRPPVGQKGKEIGHQQHPANLWSGGETLEA
jgi:hypothetical protein